MHAVLYYRSKTGFSAAILPYVNRYGGNLAGICCSTEYTLVGSVLPESVHGWLQSRPNENNCRHKTAFAEWPYLELKYVNTAIDRNDTFDGHEDLRAM